MNLSEMTEEELNEEFDKLNDELVNADLEEFFVISSLQNDILDELDRRHGWKT